MLLFSLNGEKKIVDYTFKHIEVSYDEGSETMLVVGTDATGVRWTPDTWKRLPGSVTKTKEES